MPCPHQTAFAQLVRSSVGRLTLFLWTLLSVSHAYAEADLAAVQRSVRVQQGVTCLAPHDLHQQTLGWLRGGQLDPQVLVEVLGSDDDPRSATMRVHNARGEVSERSFVPGPERCNDFLSAVGLAAALAIKKPDALPLNVRPQQPIPPPPQLASTRAPKSRPARPLLLEASALLLWPDRPPIAAGGELLVRYELAHAAQLRAGLLGARSGQARADAGFRFATRTFAARIELCVPFRPTLTLALSLCGSLLAGRLTALVQEQGLQRAAHLRQLDAGPSLLLRYALSARLGVLLGAALWLGLEPRRLSSRAGQDGAQHFTPLPRLSTVISLGFSYDLRASHSVAKDQARAGMNRR